MNQALKNNIGKDGTLFVVWGWILFINAFFLNYLSDQLFLSHGMMSTVRILRIVLPIIGLAYTVYYLLIQRNKQSTKGTQLGYVWGALFISMVLVNLIQFNVSQRINFELQHPLFMVLSALAVIVTGRIVHCRSMIFGGAVFAVLAYISSHFGLNDQMLIESIGWVVAFIIPGHILLSNNHKDPTYIY